MAASVSKHGLPLQLSALNELSLLQAYKWGCSDPAHIVEQARLIGNCSFPDSSQSAP